MFFGVGLDVFSVVFFGGLARGFIVRRAVADHAASGRVADVSGGDDCRGWGAGGWGAGIRLEVNYWNAYYGWRTISQRGEGGSSAHFRGSCWG